MEDVLTKVSDPNVVLEPITSQRSYLSLKLAERENTTNETIKKTIKMTKIFDSSIYKNYIYIDRVIEGPKERGTVTLHTENIGINPRTALHVWQHYAEIKEVVYKKKTKNRHSCTDDIIESVTSQLEDFKISKSQMNHHLRNRMLIPINKPTFGPR
ncbi:hypothetical protein J3Q64DRAFT_1814845 [Phycomyces blakesleeanus]|uniref:Homeodomain-like DNA binding domain-containing transcription factor n=1 Tax=Phycomyces blakesleeanus TaxID=4837 RepID=A0ABR3AVX2_PHYBL